MAALIGINLLKLRNSWRNKHDLINLDLDELALSVYQSLLGVLCLCAEFYAIDAAIRGARFYFSFKGRALFFVYLAIPITPQLQMTNWWIGATGIMLLAAAVIFFAFSFTKYPFPQKGMLSSSRHGTDDSQALLGITVLEKEIAADAVIAKKVDERVAEKVRVRMDKESESLKKFGIQRNQDGYFEHIKLQLENDA